MIDWSKCPDVERDPQLMSGAWTLKGTRIRVQDILVNAVDQTPEEIARDIYEGLDAERVRRVIAFARNAANAPAA